MRCREGLAPQLLQPPNAVRTELWSEDHGLVKEQGLHSGFLIIEV